MRLHGRQFVVGPGGFAADATWRQRELGTELVLSSSDWLPVREQEGSLELGVHVGGCGRWCEIRDEVVTLDPGGTLGCFFRVAAGRVWASSSPELLRRLKPELPLASRGLLRWGGDREWFAGPASGIPGISRLLPSQRLNLRTGEIQPRPLLPPLSRGRTYEELLERLEARLRGSIAGLAMRFDSLWLPLTAGLDSRLLLAACAAEGIPVTAFTFEGPPGHHNPSDLELPGRLAQAIGVEHRTVPRGLADEEAVRLWDEHTAFHSSDLDRDLVSVGQWNAVPREALILGGNVFEAGRCYYHLQQPEVPPEYADWTRLHPSEVDWRDRLYLEQRIGGWLSSFEQGLDATGRTRVHVANDATLIALLLSLPDEIRAYGTHQLDLIARLAPELARFEINPVPLRDRVGNRLRRERALYRHHGAFRYLGHRLRRLGRRLRSTSPA